MLLFLLGAFLAIASWSLVEKVGYKKRPIFKPYKDFDQEFPGKRGLPLIYHVALIGWMIALFFIFTGSLRKVAANNDMAVLWFPLVMFQGWGALTATFELTTGITFMLRNRQGRGYSIKDYAQRSAILQVSLFAVTIALYILWLQFNTR